MPATSCVGLQQPVAARKRLGSWLAQCGWEAELGNWETRRLHWAIKTNGQAFKANQSKAKQSKWLKANKAKLRQLTNEPAGCQGRGAQTMCWHAFGQIRHSRVSYGYRYQFVSRTNSARTWASWARTWIGVTPATKLIMLMLMIMMMMMKIMWLLLLLQLLVSIDLAFV